MTAPTDSRRPSPPEGYIAFKWKTRRDPATKLSMRLCPVCGEQGEVWDGGGWTDPEINTLAGAFFLFPEDYQSPDWPFYRDHPSRYGTGRCLVCSALYWHDMIGDGKSWQYYYLAPYVLSSPDYVLSSPADSGMVPETGKRTCPTVGTSQHLNPSQSQEDPSPMAKPSSTPNFDFSKLVSPTELAEGGGFGPTSFRGAVIGAAYGPHRYTPKEGFKEGQDASYFQALHLKFRVDEVLDDSGWEPSDHDGIFDYPLKLGGKSLRFLYATNDTRTPAGIDGGFEEQALLAAGRTDQGVVNFSGKLEDAQGRWLFPIPGIPEGKGKIEPKSSYNMFLEASAPAIAAVDPSEVVEYADKKGNPVITLPANSNTHLAADGLPSGALYFVGLSGVWDTKKITLENLKDEKGNPQTQKFLYLSSYDGREEIATEAAPAPAKSAAAKKATAPTAKSKPAPAATSVQPPTETDSDDLDSQVIQGILAELPLSGPVKVATLGPKVVMKFPAAERTAAGQAYLRIAKEASTKDDAAALAEAGMDSEILFTYDSKSQTLERWTTAE